jgi:RNA polymerase sigma factor (sigma-70 family)
MDDDALIAAYYACDNAALGTLVAQRNEVLVGFFEHRGLSPDEAEACAQEAWIRVIQTKHPPEGRSPQPFDPAQGTAFLGWLYAIAWNLLRDARRRSAAGPRQMPGANGEGEVFEEQIAAPDDPPDAPLIAEEASEAVEAAYQECLAGLPEPQRAVWLLEMERRQIDPAPEQRQWAIDHELTPAQYTSRLHRAREQMHSCMSDRLGGDWAG